jgi:hypothetical protein
LIAHAFVKRTIWFRYSFNMSMSKMPMMSIWHLKAYRTCLCWFVHVDVECTNCSHVTLIFFPCSFNMCS